MPKLLPLTLTLLATLVVSCNDDPGSGSAPASPSPERATAIIDTGEEVVLVDTEVADSPQERALGLMNRESLDQDEGMVFVYFEETTGTFWMKNTLVPLSIAFFDHDGKIVSILDMDPCREEPCRRYDPGVPYWGALEVNQGAFEEWGVEVGDVIRLNQ